MECKHHSSYGEHITAHINDLKIDKNKVLNILELIQYTLLYTIICLYVGSIIDSWFFHASLEKESNVNLIVYITLHMITSIIAIYFIRKFVKIIPFIGEGIAGYTAHCNLFEFEGELTIGLIFIATQRNLLVNVQELYNRINKI